MRDSTLIVYWRWAWLGILPGLYLTFLSGNHMFLIGAVLVYIGAGLSAMATSAAIQLPAATVGALSWVGMMLLLIARHLPLAQMWEARGEQAIWAAVYVGGGAGAVLFLGINLDPVYSRRPGAPQ
jgi:hypothetical protein